MQPRRDIRSLEQLALLAVTEVRRVPGKVGQGRRIRDLVDSIDDLPGVPALQCGDDERLVIRSKLADFVSVLTRAADSSASTQSAVPGPETPEPIRTRRSAR